MNARKKLESNYSCIDVSYTREQYAAQIIKPTNINQSPPAQ